MKNWSAVLLAVGLLASAGRVAMARPPAEPEEAPAGADEPVPAAEPTDPGELERKKMPFGLYLGFAVGTGSSEPLDTSIAASQSAAGMSDVTFDEQLYGRGVVGWHLPHGKGDFRLIFQGIKEEEYEFVSSGWLNEVINTGGSPQVDDGRLARWWDVRIQGGRLTSVRLIPTWNEQNDDADGDETPDFGPCSTTDAGLLRCGEIMYDPANPDRVVTGTYPDDLQNRINTYDIVYGREFGGRRYSSRWWAGLRHFEYEGQLLAGAWLDSSGGQTGDGYSDGGFLKLLRITQQTRGIGPVGIWEVDFNFFDKGVQFFLRGQSSFTFNSMEMDTGTFLQITDPDATGNETLEDRMAKSLDKSTWQGGMHAGTRINFENGLEFELAVSKTWYTDVVLTPSLLQLGVTNGAPQSATQDIEVDLAYFAAGFQF